MLSPVHNDMSVCRLLIVFSAYRRCFVCPALTNGLSFVHVSTWRAPKASADSYHRHESSVGGGGLPRGHRLIETAAQFIVYVMEVTRPVKAARCNAEQSSTYPLRSAWRRNQLTAARPKPPNRAQVKNQSVIVKESWTDETEECVPVCSLWEVLGVSPSVSLFYCFSCCLAVMWQTRVYSEVKQMFVLWFLLCKWESEGFDLLCASPAKM